VAQAKNKYHNYCDVSKIGGGNGTYHPIVSKVLALLKQKSKLKIEPTWFRAKTIEFLTGC